MSRFGLLPAKLGKLTGISIRSSHHRQPGGLRNCPLPGKLADL